MFKKKTATATATSSLSNSRSSGGVDAATIFKTIDSKRSCKIYLSDLEMYVMPQLSQIMHSSNINSHDLPSITEMTHNISLAIFKVADISHDGYIEKWEVEQSAK